MVKLNTKETIITSIRDDLRLSLEVILTDPAFNHMIEDLINAKNKNELSGLMANKLLEGYHYGLMMCYNLLKKYDKLQVYDVIEGFDEKNFIKGYLKHA